MSKIHNYIRTLREPQDCKAAYDKLEPLSPEERRSEINQGAEEHEDYKINDIQYLQGQNGELKFSFNYEIQKEGQEPIVRDFEMSIRANEDNSITHEARGLNLGIKDPGTRGGMNSAVSEEARNAARNASNSDSSNDSSKDSSVLDNENTSDYFKKQSSLDTIKFNASHLIADWFMGSGYKNSLNVVTTSEHYNKVVMRGAENKLEDALKRRERLKVKRGQASFITFDLIVTATYLSISDSNIAQKIRNATGLDRDGEQNQELLDELYSELSSNKDPMLCKRVIYNLQSIYLDGDKAKKEPAYLAPIPIGEDTHFKEVL